MSEEKITSISIIMIFLCLVIGMFWGYKKLKFDEWENIWLGSMIGLVAYTLMLLVVATICSVINLIK